MSATAIKSGSAVILGERSAQRQIHLKRGATCKEVHCEQKSPAWWDVRRGVPTASEFDRLMTPKKMEYASAARKYMALLSADLYNLNPKIIVEQPISRAMQFGVDCEPEARAWYESEVGMPARQIGFCMTEDERFGCSPDSLVNDEGVLELKCPQLETLSYYLDTPDKVPEEYLCQVHGHLIVTGRKWCDFVVYSPGLHAMRIRVTPNEFTDKLRVCLELFWNDYTKKIDRLYAMGNTSIVP
jgi:putative phage-type endonuclease